MSHKDGVDGDGDGEGSGGAAAAVVVMLVGEEERAPAQERGSCSGLPKRQGRWWVCAREMVGKVGGHGSAD